MTKGVSKVITCKGTYFAFICGVAENIGNHVGLKVKTISFFYIVAILNHFSLSLSHLPFPL
jgi:hypothetical protein